MKRFVSILSIFCITIITAQAQSPGQFDYQAVLRDGSGNLMKNQTVDLRIGIYDGSSMEYEETHNVTTDQYGLVSLAIGQGTVSSGTFSSLDWANSQYEIKVEVDDGSGYVSLGQKALSSVPYALHAESAPAPSLAMDNLTDVNAGSPSSNEVLKWDGSNWVPQADNAGGSSIWSTSSGDVYYNSGYVGIGNTSPSASLHLTLGGTGISDGFKMTGSGNEDWYFYLPSSNSLTLRDDGTDIVTFENSTGNVGIGTTTPSQLLDVNGSAHVADTLVIDNVELTSSFGILYSSDEIDPESDGVDDLGGPNHRWQDLYALDVDIEDIDPASANRVTMNGSFEITDDTLVLGNVEFYETGSYQVDVDGAIDPVADGLDDLGSATNRWDDLYATNGTIQTSDRRDKTNIRELDYGLKELMALKPVRFKWKEKSEQGDKLGLVAQDLQKVIAEVVKTHDYERQEDGSLKKVKNERLGVYYADLIPVLIKSIQEQQQEIEELKEQNEELEQMKQELQSLKQQIKSLK